MATPSTGQSSDDIHEARVEEFRDFASFSTQNSCTVFAFEAAATHFACYFQIYLQKRKIISLVQLLSGILQLYQIKTAKTQKKRKHFNAENVTKYVCDKFQIVTNASKVYS